MVKERAHTFLTTISISSLTSTSPRRAVSNAGRRSPPRLENAKGTEELGLDGRRAAVDSQT